MEVFDWRRYVYFPGVFAVMAWSMIGYIDLIPRSVRSVILDARLVLLYGWISLVLLNRYTSIFRGLSNPIQYMKFPHGYLVIYAVIAFLSAIYAMDKYSVVLAINLVIFSLLAVLVTTIVVEQMPAQSIGYIKWLWDLTLFLIVLRLLFFLIGVFLFFDQAVNVVNLGSVRLLRVRAEGFWGALNANTVGYLGALLLVVALNRLAYPMPMGAGWLARAYWGMLGCLSVIVLILGYSRTSFVALALVGIVYLAIHRKFLWVVGIGVALVIASIQSEGLIAYLMRGQNLSTFSSFSDRWYVWVSALYAFQESPLIGFGYFHGEQAPLAVALNRLYPEVVHLRTSHNAFLSVLLGTGLLGFIPFFTFFTLLGWRIVKHFQSARWQGGIYGMIAYEVFAIFLILWISSLTLTMMVYQPTSIRNLPLLTLLIFAGLPITVQAGYLSDTNKEKVGA